MAHEVKPASQKLLASVKQVNPQAPKWVFERLRPHYPNASEQFQRACLEDLHHHVSYLTATLECGYVGIFEEYAVWLKDVLEKRGIPIEGLALSFTYLADYYSAHLPSLGTLPLKVVLDAGVAALSRSEVPPAWPSKYAPTPLADVEPIADTLLTGNRQNMNRFLETCRANRVSYLDFAVGLAQPAMYDIGRRWQERKVTVAQEHIATSLCQYALALYFSKSEFQGPLNRTALFACIEGNHHAVGLRIISDHFELAGWTVQFLGANTPTRDLLAQVDIWRPEVVGLSVSLPSQIRSVREVTQQLRAEFNQDAPTILVGGLTTNQVDGLWRQVGADGWAPDASYALESVT